MLTFFNKIIKSRISNGPSSKKGQLAVILVLFFAILLVVLSIMINLGKISQVRTASTVAVDTASSLMASTMASYAESLYQNSIASGGHREQLSRRELKEWVGAVFTYLILLVVIVLCLIPGTQPLGLALLPAAGIGAGIATVCLIVQAALITPEINEAWGKMFSGLEFHERAREQAVNSMLMGATADTE